jgi:integrating conjugative element protein (TIGR03759 family)
MNLSRGTVTLGWMGIALAVSLSVPVVADVASSERSVSTQRPTPTASTAVLDQAVSSAQQWDLQPHEWERYRTLMQGIRGSVSPANLSPLEVLGIHAETDDERRRYAERWARLMREDAERVLAFQRAYNEAHRRLYPNAALIDPAVVPRQTSAAPPWVWNASDRVLLFAETQCPACDAVLERMVGQLASYAGIDVYLIDVAAGDEARIRAWARDRKLDPELVREQKITLNIDAGALAQVIAVTGQHGRDLPLLVVRRGEELTQLPASRF